MEITHKVNGRDVVVSIGNVEIANDGIGFYEFWGSKEFDKGEDYVESFEVVEIVDDESNETIEGAQAAAITEILEDDESFIEKVMVEYEMAVFNDITR